MNNSIVDLKISYSTPLSGITEPVTLQEVKDHLEISFSDRDAYITRLIREVREYAERLCDISLVEKTIVMVADWFTEHELPFPPHKTISKVEVKTGMNASGATYSTLVPGVDYWIDGDDSKVLGLFSSGRIRVTYEAGPATTDDIPTGLKLAILNELAWRFENRGDNIEQRRTNYINSEAQERNMWQLYKNVSW